MVSPNSRMRWMVLIRFVLLSGLWNTSMQYTLHGTDHESC